jgi:hypothetical protein
MNKALARRPTVFGNWNTLDIFCCMLLELRASPPGKRAECQGNCGWSLRSKIFFLRRLEKLDTAQIHIVTHQHGENQVDQAF